MSGSKPLKLSILTLLALVLFLSGFLAANAQNTEQSSSTASIFSIGHIWQDIKGEYIKLLSQSKDIQVRESAAVIKEEWKKEINEMRQSIAELWRKLKERVIPATPQSH